MTGILIIMNVFIHPWTLGNLTVKYLSINSNYPWNLSHGRNVASTISAVSNKKCYRLSYCKFSLLDISMQINHAKFVSYLEKCYGIFFYLNENFSIQVFNNYLKSNIIYHLFHSENYNTCHCSHICICAWFCVHPLEIIYALFEI